MHAEARTSAQRLAACTGRCKAFGLLRAQEEVVELKGSNQEGRMDEWTKARVLFMTPAILNNDIATGKCPEESIVCIVVDECHRCGMCR